MIYLVEKLEPQPDGRTRVVTRASGARWPRLAVVTSRVLELGAEVTLEPDGRGGLDLLPTQEIAFPGREAPQAAPPADPGP